MHRAPRSAAVVALLVVVASCGSRDAGRTGGQAGDVTVFAAASLTEAFTAIGDAYMVEHPGSRVVLSFGGSSSLATQIVEGAPADVFAAADPLAMTALTGASIPGADHPTDDPVAFATNSLEIIVGPGNPLGITGLADLADQDFTVVTCAIEVPCGRYAGELFDRAGVSVTPRSLESNVKAVVTKVILGEADAGIVYTTDVVAAGDRATGVPIPTELDVEVEYPIIATGSGGNPVGGGAFVDFVLSPRGQRILASFGFGAP